MPRLLHRVTERLIYQDQTVPNPIFKETSQQQENSALLGSLPKVAS